MAGVEETAVGAVRPHARGEAGFTLLELIVTVMILALAVAVVAPAVGRSLDGVRGRADVAGFAAVLRHARELAIADRTTESVVIESADHRLTIRAGGPDGDVKETRALPERLTIDGGGLPVATVRFDPQGTSTGGEFRVTSGSAKYLVSIDALTGRVRSVRR